MTVREYKEQYTKTFNALIEAINGVKSGALECFMEDNNMKHNGCNDFVKAMEDERDYLIGRVEEDVELDDYPDFFNEQITTYEKWTEDLWRYDDNYGETIYTYNGFRDEDDYLRYKYN